MSKYVKLSKDGAEYVMPLADLGAHVIAELECLEDEGTITLTLQMENISKKQCDGYPEFDGH